jgi:hypothetical protein
VAGFAGKLAILIVKAELNKERKILLFPSGKCNQSHADNFRVVFVDLFFPLTFSWTDWYRYYRVWEGFFFFDLFMDGLVLTLPVLGHVAIFLAFQFEVFGRERVKTL